ncbi:MAG TPA: TIGR01777 family oxidoreductase [Gemmatimonadaceae bacterium]|nr:TIGR01777 family oxidoreductase [Gemmatimonadaceae bacterium]
MLTRVLVSGATGFIGSALVRRLRDEGVAVRRLTRRAPEPGWDDARWDPEGQALDPRALADVDAVVHLAGEKIDQRWTEARKRALRESRVRSTDLLARAIAAAPARPRVLVSGSAIGIYGDRGDELLDERSAPGDDFLSRLAVDWEAAAAPAADAGVRVVHPRTGIVLSPRGGALARMLPPFKLGVGGPTGSGRQWFSWIALDDMVSALNYALRSEALRGPMNCTAPSPVRNAEFASALGRALHRPALVPTPPFALSLLFGREMVHATLLASQRAVPRALLDAGYTFRWPELAGALGAELAEGAV